ncbi:cache domain-containing protein [Desulfopila sp. IMCC35008]|uniref:cache domain-containing protein n=1 Tax=Desulfopila sp. IMCC35008 TaxID=2653858 RepID=UPI0013D55C49|nr:cache domain-containing protein [Desulfopila sp. IMCC35008]
MTDRSTPEEAAGQKGYQVRGRKVGKRKVSLSSAPFYASILVIFGLTLFVGIFWMVNEYQAYQESIENIRSNYNARYKERVKEEYDKVVSFVEYKRSQTDQHIEDEIRDKVQTAYTVASHMYSMYKDEKTIEELESMVAEILRPIRWNNGRGYYFAGSMADGTIDLFADEPWFEGKDRRAVKEIHTTDVLGDIIYMVREKGAGIYHYDLKKPQFVKKVYPKVAFVKYFEPFDWFIGAGIYTEELEKQLKNEILSRIQSMYFGKDGEVFGFRDDGTIICNRDVLLIGRSVMNLMDDNNAPYGREMLETAMFSIPGGFIRYAVRPEHEENGNQRLSYVQQYRDWGWVFGTSMSMAEMERAIAFETQSYRDIAFKNVFIFIALFIVAVSLLLFISYFYSLKIKEGINLFTDFFRQATDSNVQIGDMDLAFAEFEDLRRLANRMVDDRIQKEILLRRDEVRLDTLLHLGMMDKQTLQDKYNFVLQRVVQITRSAQGYLALVNTTQTHVSICSLVIEDNEQADYVCNPPEVSRKISEAGFIGAAVINRSEVICNAYRGEESYPYKGKVSHHFDVPVLDDGKIVMVVGVCNNGDEYDNSDVRQVKMLAEGMWLHVLKTCAEKEMARLERQIIAVSEEERSNIGRDLHDNLGSHLTGVELLSKVLQQKLEQDDPDKAQQLATIRDLIRDAIEKTRRLAQGLYPAHVIEHGLEAAIEELVNEAENLFRVQCTYSFEGDREWVDNAVATHVYYITREAVFNAARHGRPDNIGIFMRTDPRNFAVRIVDDGSGFDDNTIRKGLGCHTMQYRAKAIGADLTISSEINGGTIVSISGEVHT